MKENEIKPTAEQRESKTTAFEEALREMLADIKPDDVQYSSEDFREALNEQLYEACEEKTRVLTQEERAHYKDTIGCSDKILDRCIIDDSGKIIIRTINDSKEGQESENGVRYEKKTIIVNGVEIEGVFPVFDSEYDTQLPEDKIKETDAKQNEYCNEQLKNEVENNPELAENFTPEQIEQIKNNETPDGYTWHHNEESGKMQLVKTEDHQANRHTGGKAIWGGGQENR